MHPDSSGRQCVNRLYRIRSRFDANVKSEKLELLERLGETRISNPQALERLHSTLSYLRAFPDSRKNYRLAGELLERFGERIDSLPASTRAALDDTGIEGTTTRYAFSYDVARWLARRTSGIVRLDWQELDDSSNLDELLAHVLESSEDEYFDSEYVSTQEWIDVARGVEPGTDFDWLAGQLDALRPVPIARQLYDSAELPLAWKLRGGRFSKTLNSAAPRRIGTRECGMRRRPRQVKAEIMRPLKSLRLVSPRRGARLVDVAMAALAVRHRETHHFNYANPREVYVADVRSGVSIAVFGLRPAYRYPLECTMGYLILANGMPVGYGGGSALFRQVNTGINIFDEFRDSEASFLWTQVMRIYHQLTGCTRFIANAYQFGGDNDEALQSGAFWFYYRQGFRPVLRPVRELARREALKIRSDRGYRSSVATLRRLGACDMHLMLPSARASELFEESWFETCSMLATRELASAGGATRAASAQRIARKLAKDLGLRSLRQWSQTEQQALRRLAPIVAAAEPATWPNEAKRTMGKLLRAKGGAAEAAYARLLGEHGPLRTALQNACRRTRGNA